MSDVDTGMDDLAYIRQRVDSIHDCIYGNGKSGMVTRLALLEAATMRHSTNWAALVQTLLRDVVVAGMMAFVLSSVLG